MNTKVLLEDKKVFIRWILKNHKFKRREAVWILNYLNDRDDILENVIFVDEIEEDLRTMEISTTDIDGIPFRFYNNGLMTADAEKAFHSMRTNLEEKMYIKINFPDRYKCPEYLFALEDYEVSVIREEDIKITEETEELIDAIVSFTSRQSLINEIDRALDNGDEEKFMELSGMLIESKERNK